jgi:late competence protein required for DNA uptake (superfamily II DNA/RNA helicase)
MDRQCRKCGKIKPEFEFYKHKNGKYYYCRDCKNEQSRKKHKERYWNDEEYREKQKARNRAGEFTPVFILSKLFIIFSFIENITKKLLKLIE